jgi:hypothetical protein
MQAGASDQNQQQYPLRKLRKSQVDVRELLAGWKTEEMAKRKRAERHLKMGLLEDQKWQDLEMGRKPYNLGYMDQTPVIKTMQDQIDYKVTEHVLGLADPPVATQHNIKALACVFFRSLRDVSGQLQEKQGANVPVVHITDLVVASPNPRFLAGWEDDLIRGIVAWAKHMDKFVTVMPADEETEEYYKSLGFQRFESLPFIMVYRGKKEKDVEATPSRGLLLDLPFESRRQIFV